MEISNMIFKQSINSGAGINTHLSNSNLSFNYCRERFNLCFGTGEVKRFPAVSFSGFSDSGHLDYYVSAKKKEKESTCEIKKVKKKLKAIKRFSRDMAIVSDMAAAGIESENSLIGEVKGKMISEAMELLQKQLQQMKAEQKELKKKKKAELKATMVKSKLKPDSSSSSSSSECDMVISTSRLRTSVSDARPLKESREPEQTTLAININSASPIIELATHLGECCNEAQISSINSLELATHRGEFCNEAQISSINSYANIENNKKVEICMGGKCKKMGAIALLEEFEKKIGNQGEVVGCKCMGKCKSAPNVRLKNHVDGIQTEIGEEGFTRTQANPLFIGVAIEDVSEVVATFLGKQSMHLAPA